MIMLRKCVDVFFSCDDNYLPFLSVAVRSLIDNSSPKNDYHIRILNGGINGERANEVLRMATENVKIELVNVEERVKPIKDKLCLRDYYTASIYYRIFIPAMFPEISKAIYLDSDIVVLSDIAKLYDKKLGKNLVGAISDAVVAGRDEFRRYSDYAIGIPYAKYFNSGVMLMNLSLMRKYDIEGRFSSLLCKYSFPLICPDQDYLNFLCRGRVLYIGEGWNKMSQNENYRGTPMLIHYNMFNKPWKYDNVPYGRYFTEYAVKTPFYDDIIKIKEGFTESDAKKDREGVEKLLAKAVSITESDYNFSKTVGGYDIENNKAEKESLEIAGKIENYEKLGGEYFFCDVENDPPSKTLMPDDVDYLCRKTKNKIYRFAARIVESGAAAVVKMKYDIRIEGIENLRNIEGGAVITSNHFSPTENLAVREAIKTAYSNKPFYKIVREGNYFMPGMIGFLLKYCDTLPLSGNIYTMAELNHAVDKLLKDGSFILIYPEQAMWRNYGKPRPYRIGAYYYAAKSNVPVIPCFVTLSQEGETPSGRYTVHVMPPIYPDKNKSVRENAAEMQKKNFELCKEKYEEIYKIPLEYAV